MECLADVREKETRVDEFAKSKRRSNHHQKRKLPPERKRRQDENSHIVISRQRHTPHHTNSQSNPASLLFEPSFCTPSTERGDENKQTILGIGLLGLLL
jgi:hypothetical protein